MKKAIKKSDYPQLVNNIKDYILGVAVKDKFIIEFVKKDGTLRELAGTFVPPEEWTPKGPGLKYSPRQKGLLQVWDLEKEGWRMVNVLTIQKINMVDVAIDIRRLKVVTVPVTYGSMTP